MLKKKAKREPNGIKKRHQKIDKQFVKHFHGLKKKKLKIKIEKLMKKKKNALTKPVSLVISSNTNWQVDEKSDFQILQNYNSFLFISIVLQSLFYMKYFK